MFTTALHENETMFDIMEVSSSSIERIIKYAYLRDTSFIDESNVNEIYIISDYFGVLGLMKACINFIIKTLSPVNCIGFWIIARYLYSINFHTFNIHFSFHFFFSHQISQHTPFIRKVVELHPTKFRSYCSRE